MHSTEEGETKTNPKKAAMVHIEVLERETKRKKYFYTGVKMLANQYSPTGGFSVKNHPNALILKTKVFDIYLKIEAFIHSDKCTCLDDVQNWDKKDEDMNFLMFIEHELRKKNVKDVTIKTHRALINGLVRFCKIKTFKDLIYANISDYDVFLKKTLKSQSTLYKRHAVLNSYIKEAVRRELISRNPYDSFHCKRGKSKEPVTLDETELKKIIDYQRRIVN